MASEGKTCSMIPTSQELFYLGLQCKQVWHLVYRRLALENNNVQHDTLIVTLIWQEWVRDCGVDWGRFKNFCELLNLRALRISTVFNETICHIIQRYVVKICMLHSFYLNICMGEPFSKTWIITTIDLYGM